MFGPSKMLGIEPFPNSVSHFEAQWQQSWISHVSNTGFAPRIRQLSYRGGANLKIMIFVFDMLVIMLMDLENCKKQTWWFQSWQIEEELIGKPPLELSRIVQNLTNLFYRGGANLKISIILLNMFVCRLIELENHKILQNGCFWSWQIKEEGKSSSIDITGQLLCWKQLK